MRRTSIEATVLSLALGCKADSTIPELPAEAGLWTASAAPYPLGLAFDAAGNLWVVNADGRVTGFAQASLDASDAPVPIAQVQVSGHSLFWSLAFWPKPAGLPLN